MLNVNVDICKRVSKLTVSQFGLLFLKEILIGLEEKNRVEKCQKKPKSSELLEEPTLKEASEETAALGRVTSGFWMRRLKGERKSRHLAVTLALKCVAISSKKTSCQGPNEIRYVVEPGQELSDIGSRNQCFWKSVQKRN